MHCSVGVARCFLWGLPELLWLGDQACHACCCAPALPAFLHTLWFSVSASCERPALPLPPTLMAVLWWH